MTASTEQATRTAVVMAVDGVRFVACGPDGVIAEQLAGYVSERCEYTLWPNDARMVRSLLEASRVDDAITFYFAVVGQRWDDERLELDGPDRLARAQQIGG